MKECKLTHAEISKRVSAALYKRNLTLEACCDLFEDWRAAKKLEAVTVPLNKDFIQRIKANNFKVITKRVDYLCQFLEIDISESSAVISQEPLELQDEFERIDRLVTANPVIKPAVAHFLQNITEMATAQGAKI